jgi:hypothetical protein
MTDLTRVPKPHVENISAIADFAELDCLRRDDKSVSTMDLTRILVRETDASGEESVLRYVSEAFEELADRSSHCGPEDGRYPYKVIDRGTLLQVRSAVGKKHEIDRPESLYFFLLLATQMNMKTRRRHGGEDATVLFEHLCSEVAARFWGGPARGVHAFVFGTGRETEELEDHEDLDEGKFKSAVDRLCRQLGEGYGFRAVGDSRVTARDGKLDVVVWRRFADERPGQLIGFGQCKTGKHWSGDLMKLRPEGFCRK